MLWMTLILACSTDTNSPEAKAALLQELLSSPEFQQAVQKEVDANDQMVNLMEMADCLSTNRSSRYNEASGRGIKKCGRIGLGTEEPKKKEKKEEKKEEPKAEEKEKSK